ncbi:hypothetical protein SETIT_9G098700v2 [Setaria italica]|uniref:Uncharacterized protein n=2 Tax=Setaria TaxID=4554 RepID=A0A368SF39_SETIT|nr:hypothetical protein SETIT_9G098700v2 [Setaria italica]TKV91441.1 hypothetical protein SEVIR_9G096900v2 [Setaria viridis]
MRAAVGPFSSTPADLGGRGRQSHRRWLTGVGGVPRCWSSSGLGSGGCARRRGPCRLRRSTWTSRPPMPWLACRGPSWSRLCGPCGGRVQVEVSGAGRDSPRKRRGAAACLAWTGSAGPRRSSLVAGQCWAAARLAGADWLRVSAPRERPGLRGGRERPVRWRRRPAPAGCAGLRCPHGRIR